MDQNFSLMAQSRANYYTAGSPVQFVRVELLKGDTTGEVAVCLTLHPREYRRDLSLHAGPHGKAFR